MNKTKELLHLEGQPSIPVVFVVRVFWMTTIVTPYGLWFGRYQLGNLLRDFLRFLPRGNGFPLRPPCRFEALPSGPGCIPLVAIRI